MLWKKIKIKLLANYNIENLPNCINNWQFRLNILNITKYTLSKNCLSLYLNYSKSCKISHKSGHTALYSCSQECHKCLVAMALEEVLKHECESGFVIEISETDAADSADHKKEFFKMIVTPRRDEVVTASKSEIKETKKFEPSPKTSESDDQVKLEAPV